MTETIEAKVTPKEAGFMRAGGSPFVYRPVGTREWYMGWSLPGADVEEFLRKHLEPSLGPLEIQVEPVERPCGVTVGAWAWVLAHRAGRAGPVSLGVAA